MEIYAICGLALAMALAMYAIHRLYGAVLSLGESHEGRVRTCPWCGKAATRGEVEICGMPVGGYYTYCGNVHCDIMPCAFSTSSQADADRMWNTRAKGRGWGRFGISRFNI